MCWVPGGVTGAVSRQFGLNVFMWTFYKEVKTLVDMVDMSLGLEKIADISSN